MKITLFTFEPAFCTAGPNAVEKIDRTSAGLGSAGTGEGVRDDRLGADAVAGTVGGTGIT